MGSSLNSLSLVGIVEVVVLELFVFATYGVCVISDM
jgi:hypothetical protein